MTTTTSPGPRDDVRPLRIELASLRHSHSVNDLLEARTDLQGVHPLADLVHDAVRWSA